ncbi:MAG: DUF3108 domain-containing protein [Alphaproteobacteria bacterium]|nr:DUF3108 domain-containing protein [Alphaproteobacteria bacterium]
MTSARFFCGILFVFFLLGSGGQAQAAKAKTLPDLPPLETQYDVYVGGIHLISGRIWFEEQKGRYRTIVRAGTHGFWHWLFPWDTVLEAKGRIKGARFEPQVFFTRDVWDDKPRKTWLRFDGRGDVVPAFDPPNNDKNREAVTKDQRRGALDPITALLQLLGHVAVEKNCRAPVAVFDGKRRFDITGRDLGEDEISGDGYGAYSGPARRCTADFTMVSGAWKDREHARFWKKSETEDGRDPFSIWLASPEPSLPELPVRLETRSIGGLVIVHLTSWKRTSTEAVAKHGTKDAL